MSVYTRTVKGLKCYILENEQIRLAILPELGAKIASLIYKPQNFEVLFQPADGVYRLAEYGADFDQYDTSGADEMFPNIDYCIYPYEGYLGTRLPDHGELWSIPWKVKAVGEQLVTEIHGVALPYVFTRSATLNGSTVHLAYKVRNTGGKPLYGLWAFHGLVACDEATRLILPETEQIITVHDSQVLGPAKTAHEYPVTLAVNGNEYRLDRISPRSAGKTEKFYVKGRVKQGEAAVTLNKGQLIYKLGYPADQAPYLGIWLNEGGFKGEYNCALEPSTGFYDSLETAYERNSLEPVEPGETMEWYLDIELKPC